MSMPCRITDECVNNPWESDCDEPQTKSMTDMTLYDLMAEDLDVWVSKNKVHGLDLEIDDENGKPLVREAGIHRCAADSFADFCRRYLHAYERAIN